MKSAFLLISGLAVALMSAPTGAAVGSPVHDLCQMSWGSEPEARRICIEQQIEGAQIVARYLDWAKRSAGADGRHVVDAYENCQALWLPDYATMAQCLQRRSAIAPPDWSQAE